jgi:arabinose-5-phosphate isomerase
MNDNQIIENAKHCFNVEIEALKRTAASLNQEFIKAVKLLLGSHKVIVSGVGKSGIIGQKIAATLSSTGVTSVFLHPVEALHGDIGMVQSDDVAILISKSGNTEELVRIIPYLKMRNAKMIAIVGNKTSHIASNSDVVLDASVESEACPFNLAPTSSTTTTLAIGDALAVCLMRERNFTLEDFSKLHPLGQIGKTITLSVSDVMKNINDIPILNKKASFKDALIAMTQKPMGCLCITDPDNKLLGILTDGDIRRVLQNANNIENILSVELNEIMISAPVTISEKAQLVEALALMENRKNQISVLPVVDNKKLIGLIRIHDVVGNS